MVVLSATSKTVPCSTSQIVNGVTIKIRDMAPTVITKMILHCMLSDELAEIFVKATCAQYTKYDLTSLLLNDQDKLDDKYNLENNIERTRQAMGNYDYDNIFNIVKQDKTPGSVDNLVLPTMCDTFKDYAMMTTDEVAWSNKWYQNWTA
jgi:hypothetical protein